MSAPVPEAPDAHVELARWLQEVGRRRVVRAPRAAPPPGPVPAPARKSPRWRPLAYVVLLGLAYLEFFFADVLLQIFSLRSVIVFLLPG